MSQRQIANSEAWLGHHPVHEKDIGIPPDKKMESTLRKVRQLIRDLRLISRIAILSDRKGYWICNNTEEAQIYLYRLERTAKSQSQAHLETYAAMRSISDKIRSEYFEKQTELFS